MYGTKDGEYYCESCYLDMEALHCATCGKVNWEIGRISSQKFRPVSYIHFWQDMLIITIWRGGNLKRRKRERKGEKWEEDKYGESGEKEQAKYRVEMKILSTGKWSYSQVILGEGIRFGEETYHPGCFNCVQCGTALSQVSSNTSLSLLYPW